MNISSAPHSPQEFRLYAGSPQFLKLYGNKFEGRPVNEFSRRETPPLILGGREDLDPHKISLMERNLLLQIRRKPVYLFNRHGLGAYGCAEGVEFGVLSKGAAFFRFDAHPDLSRGFEPKSSLAAIYAASRDAFSEHSYLWNLANLGYVSHIYWFKSSPGSHFINGSEAQFLKAFPGVKLASFDENEIANFDQSILDRLPADKIVLDIDYDYFGHLQHEYMFSITNLIGKIFRRSGLTLQALSPECIDPGFASRLAVNLMTSL